MKIFISLVAFWIAASSIDAPPSGSPPLRLIVFEGSDWCIKCRQLEKYVLSDTGVTNLLTNNSIEILRVDFPQHTAQPDSVKYFNVKIAEQYSFAGTYPTVILSKPDASLYQQIKIAGNDPNVFKTQILEHLERLRSGAANLGLD